MTAVAATVAAINQNVTVHSLYRHYFIISKNPLASLLSYETCIFHSVKKIVVIRK